MTLPRLTGITADVADHPITTARLVGAMGFTVAMLDDGAEVRCDTGAVVRLMQSGSPTRIGLRFAVRDLCAAAQALGDHGTEWEVIAPNVIRVERGDLAIDVTEAKAPGLAAVTTYVSDVAASARFWSALGLPVTPIDADPADPDPAEPAADVRLGDATVELRSAGLGPMTWTHLVVRVDDPLGCCVGLDAAGWPYQRCGDAVVTRTPEGCGVWVAPLQREPRRGEG